MNTSSIGSAVPTIKCEDTSPSPAAVGNDGDGGQHHLNLNVNMSAAMINLLGAEVAGTTTLRTPEIVNDVITMTNPLEQFNYQRGSSYKNGSGNDSNSSMSNGSSATSPVSGNTPSIQKTCSELIKAGLKLSIESKRKMSGSDTDGGIKRMKKEDSDDEYDSSHTHIPKNELTPEDEERRRRRRERNKIAATKCRMKKRERTVNLVHESEVLENQNVDLKAQLKDLEVQRRQLLDMLNMHSASCPQKNLLKQAEPTSNTRSSPTSYNMIRPETQSSFPPSSISFDNQSIYLRPESAHILASSYSCIPPLNGESSIDTISSLETYMTPQAIDPDYSRPDSVLSLPPNSESSFITTDGYLPKATTILGHMDPEVDYYENELSYAPSTQVCHSYSGTILDTQTKLNNNLNDGCLV